MSGGKEPSAAVASTAYRPHEVSVAGLAIVIVTYRPDLDVLDRQLQQLPAAATKIIIDNASQSELLEALRQLTEGTPNSTLIANPDNVGLAAALNTGVHVASALPSITHVLLLDQDTEPGHGQVERLLQAYSRLARQTNRVGCVGPNLVDPATDLSHGFHRARFGMWTRVFPSVDNHTPIACDNLNGSGTLMQLTLMHELGGLDEAFFIDHVDTEWAFRVKAAGYGLYGIPEVTFLHRMGESSLRFWFFGWRLWPYRNPDRHYYLFRNAVRLMQRRYIPSVWKFWASIKLLLTATVHVTIDPSRKNQWLQMRRGIRDGLRSTTGASHDRSV
ncbi:glycosyltransferase [Rhodocyclaceae bacterium SMB388]